MKSLDLTNKVLGYLKVIEKTDKRNASRGILWRCLCDCGNEAFLSTAEINYGNRVSCGCSAEQGYVGKRFGALVVLKRAPKRKEAQNRIEWLCQCDCGNKTAVSGSLIKIGRVKTCGCHIHMKGEKNPKARKFIDNGKQWIPSSDPWYKIAAAASTRAKRDNLPFGFDGIMDMACYLKSIAPSKCPVFNEPLVAGKGSPNDFSPSVDKIVPEKGYTKKNIQIISHLANSMKRDASAKQLKQFARWALQ